MTTGCVEMNHGDRKDLCILQTLPIVSNRSSNTEEFACCKKHRNMITTSCSSPMIYSGRLRGSRNRVETSAKPLGSTATVAGLIISLPTFQEEVKWPDAAAKTQPAVIQAAPHTLQRIDALAMGLHGFIDPFDNHNLPLAREDHVPSPP